MRIANGIDFLKAKSRGKVLWFEKKSIRYVEENDQYFKNRLFVYYIFTAITKCTVKRNQKYFLVSQTFGQIERTLDNCA